ncbi:ATP-binding protein [Vibrio genomosp. F10]|uniref:ATP-binding protein n=1 Tax=Vibrio genomosp. F10 TaxID=723171 RepID=UPI0002F4FF1A|nr:ATP-binding protein [Vibrio genomosp. F10]OEF09219.1 PAS domain-containing sensor histidine kinase [Vibrio genomosp. F10 str. 9ZD137]
MSLRRKLGLTLMVMLLMYISLGSGRFIATQWLLSQAQSNIEQRLLDYVGEIRHALRRFSHLPFLITNEPGVLTFLEGETHLEEQLEAELKAQLIQLDKAANTKGWYILSADGEVLISSLSDLALDASKATFISTQVKYDPDSLTIITQVTDTTPHYFLAAPIQSNFELVGIAVVQVDLSFLTEQWFADNEIIFFQDRSHAFFLSSSRELDVLKLNQLSNLSDLLIHDQLYNGTSITRVKAFGEKYMTQSVTLDDLQWKLTYLTPLKAVEHTVSWISWSAVGCCLFFILLFVIGRLRHQKHLSQLRIQKLIESSQERLTQMINKTQVGILLLTEKGVVSDINPMAMRYFNLSNSMVTNLAAWKLFETSRGDSTILPLLQNLSQHHDLAEINSAETMARRSDGSVFPVLFSITSLRWHSLDHYLVTVIDISKRKKAEIALKNVNNDLRERVEQRTEELKSAQKELIEISKMAALGRMSSAITHELNQPLTGLRTLLTSNDLLMERGETQLLKANNKLVHSLIDRMAKMTTQLKSFAFNRPEQLQEIPLLTVLEETLRIYQDRLKSIDVRIRISADVTTVLGEDQRVRQVIGNLVVNACDAMKGTINSQLLINAHSENDRVFLSLIDNGCGVSSDELAYIFEPFHTTKKIGDGLGLGLSISMNSMRDMKGKISAEPNHNGGMSFHLEFQKYHAGLQ